MEEIVEIVGSTAGWIIGIGITFGVAAGVSTEAKPLIKKAIKGYLELADKTRVSVAEMGEQLQDLYAEAQMEYEASRPASAGGLPKSPIIVP